ncbi:unnamed protein product, partial [Laminaria digitata]
GGGGRAETLPSALICTACLLSRKIFFSPTIDEAGLCYLYPQTASVRGLETQRNATGFYKAQTTCRSVLVRVWHVVCFCFLRLAAARSSHTGLYFPIYLRISCSLLARGGGGVGGGCKDSICDVQHLEWWIKHRLCLRLSDDVFYVGFVGFPFFLPAPFVRKANEQIPYQYNTCPCRV